MQDQRGIYYYPDPEDKKTRMYVSQEGPTVLFRMWHSEHAEIWDRHGWIPLDVVKRALTQGSDLSHLKLYDLDVARALLRETKRNT